MSEQQQLEYVVLTVPEVDEIAKRLGKLGPYEVIEPMMQILRGAAHRTAQQQQQQKAVAEPPVPPVVDQPKTDDPALPAGVTGE